MHACLILQGVTPAPNSVLDMLLRATNKETGRGLTDVQIAAQSNTLIAGVYGLGRVGERGDVSAAGEAAASLGNRRQRLMETWMVRGGSW